MFWDNIASLYDLFERVYNRQVFENLGKEVAGYIDRADQVLECACGTGAITVSVAPCCQTIHATDYSDGMLKQITQKCTSFDNVIIEKADMMHLKYEDNTFDKVIAGNVIHLLEDPKAALQELERVCKPGGRIIIPTYINKDSGSAGAAAKFLELLGANFKRQFSLQTYKEFFECMGYRNVEYNVVVGRMSCAIAVISKA